MAQLSPGVLVKETDFTQIVPSVSTSIGASVGQFKWGPVLDVTTVSNETQLVSTFAKPTDSNFVDWFSAKNFLDYAQTLKMVRVIAKDALNGTPDDIHVDVTTSTGTKNLLPNSGDISQASWIKSGLTATKNASTSGLPIAGSGLAYDLFETAETREHILFTGVSSNDGTYATLTFYVKPLGLTTKIKHIIATENNKSSAEITYTLTSTGTVSIINTGSVSILSDFTATITQSGTWYKCVVVVQNVPTHTNWYSTIKTLDSTGASNFLGVITNGVSFFAPQLEIATTSSTYVVTGPERPATELMNVPPATVGLGLLVKNDLHFQDVFNSATYTATQFVAKYPGALGNSLAVSLCDEANFAQWKYASEFDTKPKTSAYCANVGAQNDEVHVVVVDEDGLFTGVKGAVLEKFAYLSKASDARGVDNTRIFYGDVLNAQSQYVRYLGPVVSSRTRASSFIKNIVMNTFGSGYSAATTTAAIIGDGISALIQKSDISVVNGAITSIPLETVSNGGVKIKWNRPLTDTLPVASAFKVPLTFTTTGTTGTGTVAYALLDSAGKITSVTVSTPGTGWTGTVTAALTVDASGNIHGYTTDNTKLTTLYRTSGTVAVDGLGAVTLATGGVSAVAVTSPVSTFGIRSAVNYKMPLQFNLSGVGSVGKSTEGYALINAYGEVGSIVITDCGEGWSGTVQPSTWNSIGLHPDTNVPAEGFELTDTLASVGVQLVAELQTDHTLDRSGIGSNTPVDGAIRSIKITNPGYDFTTASVVIVDNGTPGSATTPTIAGGSGATASAILETSIAGDDWGLTALNTTTFLPRRFKSLKGGYGGTFSFSGGTDGSYVDAGKYIEGWNLFRNKEETDISLVISGDCGQYSFTADDGHVIAKHLVDNIAEWRKDCLVFLSPKLSDVNGTASLSIKTANILNYFNDIGKSSSYSVFDSGWKIQFDSYNNKYRNIPLNADIAGLCAQADYTNDTWWSPAGFTRGNIKNVISLLYNPDLSSRDALYSSSINPIVTFKGDGTILYGDKTMLGKSSAFSYINVRRLFIMLEKAIAKAAKYQLFEFNDQYTRANFSTMIRAELEMVKSKRGIIDYTIICDTTNNTGDVIDRGEFVASILIKPARSIENITLNFVAVKTSVDFTTIVAAV